MTGKASLYVEQDFWAQTLEFNMVQDLITAAECRAAKRAKKKRLKYEMRINGNIAIGIFKEQFIRLMVEEDDDRKDEIFRQLTADMEHNIAGTEAEKRFPQMEIFQQAQMQPKTFVLRLKFMMLYLIPLRCREKGLFR